MFLFRLKLQLRTATVAWQTFGFGWESFIFSVRRPFVSSVVRFMLALDNVCLPGFRRVEVRPTVFIIGHRRSGTTFLRHVLTQTREFCAFETWEIFVPSLIARKLLRGVIARLIGHRRATFLPPEVGHEVALDRIEEDEVLLLYNGNRQLVTKMTYSGKRIRSLLETFLDARIVYVVRSPLETISADLTLHRNMFDHMWGPARIPRGRLEHFYQRRYKHDVAFDRYREDLIARGDLPSAQFMVLPYDELRENLASAIGKVADFAGLRLSGELQRKITEQSGQQTTYQRKHTNLHFEEFGLTEERVREDLAFVFDKYGFAR